MFRGFPFVAVLILSILFSCKGKDEPIPSYIRIDSVSMNPLLAQGNAIHQITAVYVYTPKQLLGLFELPATIPILEEGAIKLSFVPAVYLNGSNNQLVAYSASLPFDTTINLIRGKIAPSVNPIFSYRSNTKFEWLEDFEDNSSTLIGINIPKGDTTLITEEPFQLDGKFTSQSKVYTAKISAQDTSKYLDMGSFKTIENLPNDGTDVFLEFDIKSDVQVQLALTRTTSSGSEYVPYLLLYATDGKWKRFYVNLVYETGGQASDTKYKILFSSTVSSSNTDRTIHLDNIRLSYNP